MSSLKKKFFTSLFVAAAISAPSLSEAQTNNLDSLKKKFNEFRNKDFGEKIFVHTDRTTYLTGETMWFKVYSVNASSNQSADISKVAYLEILDKEGQRKLEGKIRLSDGSGDGSFFIPATINSGNYVLRAYTAWMKNNSQEFFFQQDITIINAFRGATSPAKTDGHKKIDAQFLPEGGHLVAGIKSKVAFRVTDESGRGVDCRGSIVNNHNDTLLHFKTNKFGIGNFLITPEEGIAYRSVLRVGQQLKIVTLPHPLPQGFGLTATPHDQVIDIDVQTTVQNLSSPFVYLLVHTRNELKFIESKFITNGKTKFSVSKDKLSAGITHITLFDADLQPVCERLYFTKPKNSAVIHATTDQQQYSVRSKGKLKINVDSVILSNFNVSVSIFKKDSLAVTPHLNINSYLMLTSDLTGYVESPEFYFTDATEEQIDNLMLTHGWRKFKWSEALAKQTTTPQFLPELHGPIIKGKLYDETGKPAPNIKTYLSSPSKKVKLHGSISSADGSFMYVVPDFIGRNKIILQTNFSRDSLYSFVIDSPFAEFVGHTTVPPLILSKGLQNTILSRSVALQVQDVFYSETNLEGSKTDSVAFFGKADEIYYLDDYTRFPVMEEVMREYVKGVFVRRRPGSFFFKVLDNINKSIFNDDPLVLLDGVPVFDTDKIMNFDPKKVKKVEVMTRMFFLGRHSYPGIVSYSTYEGDLGGFELDPKSVVVDYEGLQAQRTFYTPLYESERQRSNRLPDQRTLLLWQPTLNIKDGIADIDFYTSDIGGEFEVNIQGLGSRGQAAASTATFSVFEQGNQ